MIVAGLGILASIIGIFMVRTREGANQKELLGSLLRGTLGAAVLVTIGVAAMAFMGIITWGIFGAIMTGLVAGVIIGQATEYYTSDEYKPTRGIAGQALMGPATTIIDGLAVGMNSTGLSVVTIVIGIIARV